MNNKEKIRRLYEDMYSAMIAKDKDMLERVHDENFVLVHMTGLQQSKEKYISSIMNGTLNYYSAEHENIDIDIYGNNAKMIGQSRVNAAVFGGGRNTWRLQLEISLIKNGDNWFLLSANASTY